MLEDSGVILERFAEGRVDEGLAEIGVLPRT
jgi:hypothetical protein